jgi:hypothetical protein
MVCVLALTCAAPIAVAKGGPAPDVKTLPPTDVQTTSVVLHGVIVPTEDHTTYWFEFGQTTDYGLTTPAQTLTNKRSVTSDVPITGLTPGATYHTRLVAQSAKKTVDGPDVAFTTASPIPTPTAPAGLPGTGDEQPAVDTAAAQAPPLGSVGLVPASGTVLVRAPGSDRAVPLTSGATVPAGAIVDTRHGSVELGTKLPGGAVQKGTFHGGLFEVRQPAGGKGMVELVLRGPKPTCPTAAARAAATTRKRPPRQLWGRDNHGRFRTRGSNSVATVRGTVWYVADRCGGTYTRVSKGAVSVHELRTGKTFVVRAGHSHLARAR